MCARAGLVTPREEGFDFVEKEEGVWLCEDDGENYRIVRKLS